MAIQVIATLKSWFQTGDKPTQAQFWDWLDSYWHKQDSIPIASVSGLDTALGELALSAEVEALKAVVVTSSGSTASVTLPGGTILHKLRIKSTSAQTVSVGTSPGGTQVLNSESLSSNQVGIYTVDFDVETSTTIHFSGLTGSNNIKIYLQQ